LTFLPRILGVLLVISGLCYEIDNFANFLAPVYQSYLEPYILLPGRAGITAGLMVRRGRHKRSTMEGTGNQSGAAIRTQKATIFTKPL
jgi:hypothetical protein